VKLVTAGNTRTGKTSVLRRWICDEFTEDMYSTRGGYSMHKCVNLEDESVELNVWDTAGQERFVSLIPLCLRDTNGVIVVFDVGNRESFDACESGMRHVEEVIDEGTACFALVGNKVDRLEHREVRMDEAEGSASRLGMRYFETSAKTGEGVNVMFEQVARSVGLCAGTRRQMVVPGLGGGRRGCC
jgi:small GTP-binding protein